MKIKLNILMSVISKGLLILKKIGLNKMTNMHAFCGDEEYVKSLFSKTYDLDYNPEM